MYAEPRVHVTTWCGHPPQMKKHNITPPQIVDVASLSSEVLVSPDGSKLRRAPLLSATVIQEMLEGMFATMPPGEAAAGVSVHSLAHDRGFKGTFVTEEEIRVCAANSHVLTLRGNIVSCSPTYGAQAASQGARAPPAEPEWVRRALRRPDRMWDRPHAPTWGFGGAASSAAPATGGGGGGGDDTARTTGRVWPNGAAPWVSGAGSGGHWGGDSKPPTAPGLFSAPGAGVNASAGLSISAGSGSGAGSGAGAGAGSSTGGSVGAGSGADSDAGDDAAGNEAGSAASSLLGAPPGFTATPLTSGQPAPHVVPPMSGMSAALLLPPSSPYHGIIEELTPRWAERKHVWVPDSDLVDGNRITVLSWNILAEYMAAKHARTAKLTGGWPRRMQVIVARILALRPNVVCLQEVQVRSHGCTDGSDQHADALMSALAPYGYEGAYSNGERSSTALLLWDRTLRPSANITPVEDIIPPSSCTPDVRAALRMYTSRVVVARLTHVATGRPVVACCGHAGVPLVRGPGGDDEFAKYIPLMDSIVAATALDTARSSAAAGGVAPAILWGVDFNSSVDDAAVRYAVDGRLAPGLASTVRSQALRDGISWFPHTFRSHSVPLASAYRKVLGRSLPYTNVNPKTDFVGAIDYIFYSPDVLRPLGVLDVYPWSRTLHPTVPLLPNRAVPSDHLPLLATFAFCE